MIVRAGRYPPDDLRNAARTVLRAIAALFVASPGPPPEADLPGGRPAAVAVVCAGRDALTAGAAIGLALLRAQRAPYALVLTWTGAPCSSIGLTAPSRTAARRLVTSLAMRGQTAALATGRLVHVALPPEEDDAIAASERAIAAARAGPTVLAVGGPRTSAFDHVLSAHDLVVVATSPAADPTLAQLAVEAVPLPERSVVSCVLAPTAPARLLAQAGIALTPSLRNALRPAVEAMG
jgi:2,4-dienoyl-CoA reductase-like NADH-dependent reductase (Old Yellow Enzyme family)